MCANDTDSIVYETDSTVNETDSIRRTDPLRDTVTSAIELARLTQNLAAVHRDRGLGPGGRRWPGAALPFHSVVGSHWLSFLAGVYIGSLILLSLLS
jgi:hypothetical protein